MIKNNIVNDRGKMLWLVILTIAQFALLTNAHAQVDEPAKLQKSDVLEIIDSTMDAFKQHYVFPDTAIAMDKYIHERFSEGAYNDITALPELAETLGNDMQSFSHDRHIWVSVMSPNEKPSINNAITQAEIERRARKNFGVKKVEWLPCNIGYVRIDAFQDAVFAGNTMAAAMGFLSHCDAIIIDLRYNHGGYETMVRFLASYFFEGPTLLGSLYFTETDSLEQSWTQAYVPGKKLIDADLYILTSHMTASGAEAFSYAMKTSGRGTLIGETTVGAAHWSESWVFPSLRISVNIPIARPINPVTKTSWERTGVVPHIEVPYYNALNVAYREALKRLLERTEDEASRIDLAWTMDGLSDSPVQLTPEKMQSYTGEYANGRIFIKFKNNSLFYCYSDGTEFLLTPLAEDLFGFDDDDAYRVAIIRDGNGLVAGYRLLVKGKDPRPIRERTGDI